MKKNILLIFTFIISFILLIDNVEAVYNPDTHGFSYAEDLSDSYKETMDICKYEKLNNNVDFIFYIDRETGSVYSTLLDYIAAEIYGQHYYFEFGKKKFLEKYNENIENIKENPCPAIYKITATENVYSEVAETTYHLYLSKQTNGEKLKAAEYTKGKEEEEEEEEPNVEINNCGDLFGPGLVEEINKVMNIIRIAVPMLLIVFGIVDFFKATFDNNEDEMKKDRERFIKRIIAAIIVFLVPFFVNLVLDVANTVWSDINTDTCISINE